MTRVDRIRAGDLAAIAELAAADATPDECAALIGCLGHERRAVQRRAAEAVAALARGGLPMGARLEAALGVASRRARFGAAYAYALLGDPPAALLPILIEALGDEDGDVRWASAAIVVRMQGASGLEAALCGLARSGDAAQRKMALYCLRDLAGPGDAPRGVVDAVLAALDDAVAAVRLAALAALPAVATDRPAAALRLLPRLDDPDEGVRRAAAAALGKVGSASPAVLEALKKAGGSGDPGLARAATRALALLGA